MATVAPKTRSMGLGWTMGPLVIGFIDLGFGLAGHDPGIGYGYIGTAIMSSLAIYAAAALLMLSLNQDEWDASTFRGGMARGCWFIAWMWYVVHVIHAMHWAHHWSHAAAVEHTRERSGFGEGIYVSHLFTLLWTLDVFWWTLWPASYARRSPWFDRALHTFMAFMIFCGTVVYETGFIRWAGAVMFAVLGGALAYHLRNRWRLRNSTC
jgi:hypothetical protein